jgi:predicted amidohydrolase
MVISPWGEVLAAAQDDAPGVVTADLDLAAVNAARAAIPALANRRAYAPPAGVGQ